jgi:hypothetical protein
MFKTLESDQESELSKRYDPDPKYLAIDIFPKGNFAYLFIKIQFAKNTCLGTSAGSSHPLPASSRMGAPPLKTTKINYKKNNIVADANLTLNPDY